MKVEIQRDRENENALGKMLSQEKSAMNVF
jgi:hypothetical protein